LPGNDRWSNEFCAGQPFVGLTRGLVDLRIQTPFMNRGCPFGKVMLSAD
jgi:hypothetical protein